MTDTVRVLVVEDQPLIAMDLEDLLVSRGYAVLGPEATVAAALDCLTRVTPAAALLDIDLAGETSFPVGLELKKRGVPFVFATGTARIDGGLPDELADTPVIHKPWSVDDVLSFLREHALYER
jgi:DNA-binding response OmpR family regulator